MGGGWGGVAFTFLRESSPIRPLKYEKKKSS